MMRGMASAQKGGMIRHGMSSTKKLKSLKLNNRGLVEKKKKITKVMKKKLEKQAAKSLKLSQKVMKKKLKLKKEKSEDLEKEAEGKCNSKFAYSNYFIRW